MMHNYAAAPTKVRGRACRYGCDIKHPGNLGVLQNLSAANDSILLNRRKVKTVGNLIEELCAVCTATTNFYSIVPSLLCDEHYFEWQEEKMIWELDRSTEGLYI